MRPFRYKRPRHKKCCATGVNSAALVSARLCSFEPGDPTGASALGYQVEELTSPSPGCESHETRIPHHWTCDQECLAAPRAHVFRSAKSKKALRASGRLS